MHIPDNILSTEVAAGTSLIGTLGFGFALRKLRDRAGERTTVLMGMMSAFVFAAQMVNFPVGPGVSGHLMGGLLSAVLLGPWAGACVMGAVLIVQCLLFADGGLTALGANFVNMGLIGSVVGYAIYAPIRRAIGGTSGLIFGAVVAAWLSVILAAGAFSLELAASGRSGSFLAVLGWMTLVHSAIGLGEAAITGLVLQTIVLTRPDLIPDPGLDQAGWAGARKIGRFGVAGLAVAMAVAVFLAPFASESPDGLEYVGNLLAFLSPTPAAPAEAPAAFAAPMPDYSLPGLGEMRWVTAVVGIVGTLAVFGFSFVLSRLVARRLGEGKPAAWVAGGGDGL